MPEYEKANGDEYCPTCHKKIDEYYSSIDCYDLQDGTPVVEIICLPCIVEKEFP